MNRRRRLSLAALPLILVCLACGLGGEPDASELNNYSADSVSWSTHCNASTRRANATFSSTEEPCVTLVLGGYYTAGTLTAVWMLADQEIGRAQIEFNSVQALGRRMSTGEAAADVTFQLHHPEPLPPSSHYEVRILRGSRRAAQYSFAVR